MVHWTHHPCVVDWFLLFYGWTWKCSKGSKTDSSKKSTKSMGKILYGWPFYSRFKQRSWSANWTKRTFRSIGQVFNNKYDAPRQLLLSYWESSRASDKGQFNNDLRAPAAAALTIRHHRLTSNQEQLERIRSELSSGVTIQCVLLSPKGVRMGITAWMVRRPRCVQWTMKIAAEKV